jgi:molybdopterin-guanine dinucleotide biosynthesis protein B
MTTPVLAIVGWKNSGKTTLAVKLVAELTRRGVRVASVKHAHHDADVDQEGTDSFRLRAAGAKEVALVTARRWVIMHELGDTPEPALAETLARLSPADLVIVEGYKREPVPKIEVRRREAKQTNPLAPDDPDVIAVAADHAADGAGRPVFDLDAIPALADFVVSRFGLRAPA